MFQGQPWGPVWEDVHLLLVNSDLDAFLHRLSCNEHYVAVIQDGDSISAYCHWIRRALLVVRDHLSTKKQ